MPGFGRISLWAQLMLAYTRMFFSVGTLMTAWLCVRVALELIPSHGQSVLEKKHCVASPHHHTLPSKPNLSYIKACRAPPLCVKPAGHRGCVCQDFPEFLSNCAEQMAHCDTASWFYGALWGAAVTVTNCAYRPPLDKDHITDGLGAGPIGAATAAKQVWRRCGAGRAGLSYWRGTA